MRTVSPTPAVFCSSCAWNLTERRTTFLYFGCDLITSTLTTIVLSPLSETTTPRRSWRRAGAVSGFSVRVMGFRVAGFSRTGFERCRRCDRGTWRPERAFFVSDTSSTLGASLVVSDTSSTLGASLVVSDTSSTLVASLGCEEVSDTSASLGSDDVSDTSASLGCEEVSDTSSDVGWSSVSFGVSDTSTHLLLLGIPVVPHREDAGDLALRELQARAVLERPRRGLEAQVEELLARLGEPVLELVVRQVAQVPSPQRDHRPRATRTSTSPAASAPRGGAPPWRAAPAPRPART